MEGLKFKQFKIEYSDSDNFSQEEEDSDFDGEEDEEQSNQIDSKQLQSKNLNESNSQEQEEDTKTEKDEEEQTSDQEELKQDKSIKEQEKKNQFHSQEQQEEESSSDQDKNSSSEEHKEEKEQSKIVKKLEILEEDEEDLDGSDTEKEDIFVSIQKSQNYMNKSIQQVSANNKESSNNLSQELSQNSFEHNFQFETQQSKQEGNYSILESPIPQRKSSQVSVDQKENSSESQSSNQSIESQQNEEQKENISEVIEQKSSNQIKEQNSQQGSQNYGIKILIPEQNQDNLENQVKNSKQNAQSPLLNYSQVSNSNFEKMLQSNQQQQAWEQKAKSLYNQLQYFDSELFNGGEIDCDEVCEISLEEQEIKKELVIDFGPDTQDFEKEIFDKKQLTQH